MVPPQIIAPLQAICPFYVWNANTSEVRWMTSFDTTEEDINRFVADLKKVLLKRLPADGFGSLPAIPDGESAEGACRSDKDL